MAARYLNHNTHIIDPDVNSQRSIEFLDLKNINVIAKIPYKDKVDIFYKDIDENVLFGTFTLGKNEFYEGSAKVITYQIFQGIQNIYVQSSFYKPTDYFYFFYEKNSNIYLRTFKKRQGTLGEEILFFQNGTVKSITTSKEAFIVVVNDLTNKVLLQKVKSTIEGELKLVFLMENSISQFENDLHSNLETQVFDIPFGDIPENFFSVPNEVENDRKLFLSNSNQKQVLEQDPMSLNGFVVRSGAVTEMDHRDSFTIILRYKPFSIEGNTIYETDNFKFLFYPDKLRLILSNGFQHDFLKVTPTTSIFNNGFHAFIFSANTLGDKYLFSVAEANDLVIDSSGYTLDNFVYGDSSFKINETFLKVGSNDGLDYLAIKNNFMTKNVMEDMLTAMSSNLYKLFRTETKTIDYTEIEEDRARRILDFENKFTHPLPDDIIVATNDLVIEEDGNSYLINANIIVTVDPSVVEADIYVNAEGVFRNSNIDTGTIYAKNDADVDANNKSVTIYHEKRATLKNIENCLLILVEELNFEEIELLPITVDVVPGITVANHMHPYNHYVEPNIFLEGYDTVVEQISGFFSYTPAKRFIHMSDGTLLDTISKVSFAKSPVYVNQLNIKDTNYPAAYYMGSPFFYSLYNNNTGVKKINYLFDRYASAGFEVSNLTIGNYTDWRLPTLSEIQGIRPYIHARIAGTHEVHNDAKYNDQWTTAFVGCERPFDRGFFSSMAVGTGRIVAIGAGSSGVGSPDRTFRAAYTTDGITWTIVDPDLASDNQLYPGRNYAFSIQRPVVRSKYTDVNNNVVEKYASYADLVNFRIFSVDGGVTWSEESMPENVHTSTRLSGVIAVSDTHLMAYGIYSFTESFFCESLDGGQTFSVPISIDRPNQMSISSGIVLGYNWTGQDNTHPDKSLFIYRNSSWSKVAGPSVWFMIGGGSNPMFNQPGEAASDGSKIVMMSYGGHISSYVGIVYSNDWGLTWQAAGFTGLPTMRTTFGGIQYVNGVWLIYGVYGNTSTYISQNGLNWIPTAVGQQQTYTVFFNNTTITVGNDGFMHSIIDALTGGEPTIMPADGPHDSFMANLDYYELSSEFFDAEYYNNLPIEEKLVKSDLIWISGGKVFSVTTGEVFEMNSISGCPATLCFPVRETVPDVGVYIKYDDGSKFLLPTDENFYISKRGKFAFEKTQKELDFASGSLQYGKKVFYERDEGIRYIEHEAHTSSNAYYYGLNVFLNRKSSTKEAGGTVFPLKLLDRFGIHKHLFTSPQDNLRICEHFRQRSDLIPFKIDADTTAENILVWTTLNRLQNKIGFQYGLVRDNIFNNVYDDYEVFNRKVYSQTEYFSAFHFNKVEKENEKLIDSVSVDDNGELMLIGKTENGTYAREIKKIRFFQRPKRYKSSSIILEVDVADKNDTQSYINNYKSIRDFLFKIINQWKPANIILEDIVEKETLVMAKLLQDEYTQVLVGVTPLGNFNAYYNRTVDSREVAIRASSDIPYDQINWVGIPQLNTPFLKSGVTKVINEKKNIKVTFDSRFSNANYRVFVFCPYDAKFYVPSRDRDGFIVESSSTVREEISWIALATNEISNGRINWVSGVPNGELIVNNLDRVTEIAKHSNTYTYDFTSFGYPEMESNDYTVILSTDKNVNVWVENKTSKSFTIRRSYVGDDLNIDWFVVKGNSRWWQGLTS